MTAFTIVIELLREQVLVDRLERRNRKKQLRASVTRIVISAQESGDAVVGDEPETIFERSTAGETSAAGKARNISTSVLPAEDEGEEAEENLVTSSTAALARQAAEQTFDDLMEDDENDQPDPKRRRLGKSQSADDDGKGKGKGKGKDDEEDESDSPRASLAQKRHDAIKAMQDPNNPPGQKRKRG
jgi:hypothetical protein